MKLIRHRVFMRLFSNFKVVQRNFPNFLIFLGLFIFSAHSKPKDKLTILDFVDLESNVNKPYLSENLRKTLAKSKTWNVMSFEDQRNKLVKYKKNETQVCNDPQCAFELGGLFQSNYIMFGTASNYKELKLFSLKLLSIQTAKIVWSKWLTCRNEYDEIFAAFKNMAQEIANISIDTTKTKQKKSMAIIDFSQPSFESKILFERILTHSYSNTKFDIMSPSEVKELLSILEIQVSSLVEYPDEIWDIGKKLGATTILYTELNFTKSNFRHYMALFDIPAKIPLLFMPALPKATFRDLMVMEKNFFTAFSSTLASKSSDLPGSKP